EEDALVESTAGGHAGGNSSSASAAGAPAGFGATGGVSRMGAQGRKGRGLQIPLRNASVADEVDRHFADTGFCQKLVHKMTDQNHFHILDCCYHPERILISILCTNRRVAQFSLLYRGNIEQDMRDRGIETRISQESEFHVSHDFDSIRFCPGITYAKDVFLLLSAANGHLNFYQFSGETPDGYPFTKTRPIFVNNTVHKAKITGYVEMPASSAFLTSSRDGHICLWDSRTLVADVKLDTGYTHVGCASMCLSTSGINLATCWAGYNIIPVWNMERGVFRGLRTNLVQHEHPVVKVKYFEKALFTLDEQSHVVMWDAEEFLVLQLFGGFPVHATDVVCT
ncbi:unnamed protein product, partial [Amoebophrya sp. A25]